MAKARGDVALLDECLASGMSVEAAAVRSGVHIRTAYRHKAETERALRHAAWDAAHADLRAELPSTIAALASAVSPDGATLDECVDYYFALLRAHREAAVGGESVVRDVALDALPAGLARQRLAAAYLAIDEMRAALPVVRAADDAIRSAVSSFDDDDLWSATQPLLNISKQALAACDGTFGGRHFDHAPMMSAATLAEVDARVAAAVDAARQVASRNRGDEGFLRAVTAYEAFDETARANFEAVYATEEDDAAMDAAFAARSAAIPYAAYLAWLAAADAVREVFSAIDRVSASGADTPNQ